MEILDHKIQLSNFHGPLDLLLYLIREEELNIYDIPISRVTEQYFNYITMMQKLDIDIAGEFMVVASSLMEIKARALIPPDEEEEEQEDDPKFELIKRLLEYKKYKDLAANFRPLMETISRTYTRPDLEMKELLDTGAGQTELVAPEPVVELDLWNMVRTYSRLTREIALDVSVSILYDDIPIEKVIEAIMEKLRARGEIMFSELSPDRNRFHIVRNFIAALELAREKQVEMEQQDEFGEIKLRLTTEPQTPHLPPT